MAEKRVRRICGRVIAGAGDSWDGCLDIDSSGTIREVREPAARGELDYTGMDDTFIVPGLVDIHVHLRGLRLRYKEDEYTGTRAAARGGITLVADMPNTLPPLTSPETVAWKLRELENKSVIDYRVYLGIPSSRDMLEKLIHLYRSVDRVVGFKVYPADLGERTPLVEELLKHGDILVVVHPELDVGDRVVSSSEEGRRGLRGCWIERASIEHLSLLSPEARIHVTHASCASTVEAAADSGFSVDVTPHHLLVEPLDDCLHKVNPPLRSIIERSLLLKHVVEGRVDALASDHAPHAPWEKMQDPMLCPPGIAWLEHWPHLVSCLVSAGALDMGKYVELLSLNPARIIGVERCLEPGCEASLTVISFKHGRAGAPRHSRARGVPIFMHRLCSYTAATIVKGLLVYFNGRIP